MAQKVQVFLTDDIDGESEASETISFALDGNAYEIDLNDANASLMRDALAQYVGAARRITGRKSSKPGTVQSISPRTGPDPKEVREWAESKSITVPARGRLPKDVVVQFLAAKDAPPVEAKPKPHKSTKALSKLLP